MSVVDLSDEETVAILAETFTESLADLGDATRQISVLKRLQQLLESHTPKRYIYETVSGTNGLQVVRAGGDLRIYCRLVLGLPANDEQYNVLFAFYVDPHDYRGEQLSRFDRAAQHRLDQISSFDSVGAIERYLDDVNAFEAADFRDRIERLES